MTKPKPKPKPGLLKPGMIMLAVMFLWAAQNMPAAITPGSGALWLCGAITAGLLARAALALAAPVFKILGDLIRRSFQDLQAGPDS